MTELGEKGMEKDIKERDAYLPTLSSPKYIKRKFFYTLHVYD